MALTGEEIRARLTRFAAPWSVYDGTERSEAQTFLNQLFECYGQERAAVAHFEQRVENGSRISRRTRRRSRRRTI